MSKHANNALYVFDGIHQSWTRRNVHHATTYCVHPRARLPSVIRIVKSHTPDVDSHFAKIAIGPVLCKVDAINTEHLEIAPTTGT